MSAFGISLSHLEQHWKLQLKMKNAGQAPGEGWRVGRQIVPLT